MRVISGSSKGRKLKALQGVQTRPTTDKVKESLFNMIGPYFSGGIGLDLFAGSGGLGIEALSRGLDTVIFVDRDLKATQIVKTNVQLCGFENKSEIYRNDAERALKSIIKRELAFDIIFIDPPYKKQNIMALLQVIDINNLVKQGGIVVCEHGEDLKLDNVIGNLLLHKNIIFGASGITIYKVDTKDEVNT